MYFNEVALLNHAAYTPAICSQWRDKGSQYYHTCLLEEFGILSDTPDIFCTIMERKTEVTAQPAAHLVAIQYEGVAAALMQYFLHGMCQSRFARARQAGEPDDRTSMAVLCLAAFTGDTRVMPDDIG